MKSQKVYWSERPLLYKSLRRSKQVLPFFESNQESRDNFWREAKKQQAWSISTGKKHIYLTIELTEKTVVITNLLFDGTFSKSHSFFSLLESFSRYFLKESICFRFADETLLPLGWLSLFSEKGYKGENSFTKKLPYRTALVLGGGGAHGAYQIGVWKALKESNIPIKIITGTSVGAINGALILQEDIGLAEKIWSKLSTTQVLSLPEIPAAADPQARIQLFYDVQHLAKNALKNQGIATTPLENLIRSMLDPKKIKDHSAPEFLTISTRLPDFSEVVTDIKKQDPEKIPDWLLASASFYPAMAYKVIDGVRYVDGGYRNNIPVDIAIQKGATEAFIVDVQGPGIGKKITMPQEFIYWDCGSHWTLGTFLIFDEQRNQANLELGYLEAKKMLNQLEGNWYSFHSVKRAEQIWKRFVFFVEEKTGLGLSFFKKINFLEKLRTIYKDRVVFETCGLALLELSAKNARIMPNKIYEPDELISLICRYESHTIKAEQPMFSKISAEEWREIRRQQRTAATRKEQIKQLMHELKHNKKKEIQQRLEKQPVETMLGLYLCYIKGEMEWHKNFHTKS